MVAPSKLIFEQKMRNVSCAQIVHTWHPDCRKAMFMLLTQGTKGICIFFLTMYTAQYTLLRKGISRKEIKYVLKDYLKSVIFGHFFSGSCLLVNCVQYHLLGKFNYYITTCGTGLAMGLTTCMSPKSRFSLEASYFSMMTLECLLRHFSSINILPKNETASVPYFMLCNALMMLLLWRKQNTDNNLQISWFYKPYSKKEDKSKNLCSHERTCLDDWIKVPTKYFLVGVAISAVRIAIKKFNNPKQGFRQIMNASYLANPVFLWSYTLIQKVVHCSLTLATGKDCQEYAFIAGLVSGATYIIQPNLSMLVTSVVLMTMALFEEAKKNYNLPKLPYQYICYAISTSVLMRFYMFNEKLVPLFFKAMLSQGTNGRSEIVLKNLELMLKDEAAFKNKLKRNYI